MATFLSTSADSRFGTRLTTACALLLSLLFFASAPLLRAGSVITLANGSEVDGKLSVVANAVHVDSPTNPPEVALNKSWKPPSMTSLLR